MPTIKIHLEDAEYNAIERYATRLNTKPEAVAYCALNRLMLDGRNPEIRTDIIQTWSWHRDNLPLWSDTAHAPHGYEGKPDAEPEPSQYI